MRTPIFCTLFLAVGLAVGYFGPKWLRSDAVAGTDSAPVVRALAAADTRLRGQDEELDALRARIAELEGLLASLRAENSRIASREAGLRDEVSKLNEEWTFSYGSTGEAGKFVGSMMRDAAAMRELDPNDPAMLEMGRDLFLKFASLGPILQEVQNLDKNPSEFAEFSSSVLAGAIDLDNAKQREVKSVIERYKAEAMKVDPESPRRAELNAKALEEVRGKLNEEQRAMVDVISSAGPGAGGAFIDILEAPPLDPQSWRARAQRQRASREAAQP